MPKYPAKKLSELHPTIVQVEEKTSDVIINKTILIESLIDSHLIYFGAVSRERYEWLRSGTKTLVRAEDVPELLEKRLGKRCCGNDDIRIFQIAS